MSSKGICLCDTVNGKRFLVHRGGDGRLLARRKVGTGAPAAIISIPKAGTYMVARLLEKLGYVDSELHLSESEFSDYRNLTVAQKRAHATDLYVHLNVRWSAGLIGPGQFVVGHLPRKPNVETALAGFRKLFLFRNLVDATISHMRFLADSGRAGAAPWAARPDGPDRLLAYLRSEGTALVGWAYRPLIAWRDSRDVTALSFEALMGDLGARNQARAFSGLAKAVGRDAAAVRDTLHRQVLGKSTKTFSGERTRVERYLSNKVRDRMAALGLYEMNEALGYDSRKEH